MTLNKDKIGNDDFSSKTEADANDGQESLLPNAAAADNAEIQTCAKKPVNINNSAKLNRRPLSDTEKKLKHRERLSQPCGSQNIWCLRLLSSFVCLIITWGILFCLIKSEARVGSKLLTLLVLLAVAYISGDLFKHLGLPKLLGMLLSGIAARNFDLFFDTKEPDVYTDIVVVTRQVALTCILITAGLELDAKSLRKLSLIVLELSFIPCIIEAVGVAVCCKVILDLPWAWGMLIGFVLGAVSPAVVVPALLSLQRKGYDSSNKISTIVIAAASFDDIVAITGFGVFYGIIFGEGNVLQKLIRGPLEIVVGLLGGTVWGILAAWLPHRADKHLVVKRVIMIGGGGIFFVLGSPLTGYDGIGPLCAIVSAFVACICWKWQGWSAAYNPVRDVFGDCWILLEPALFALIGAEIDLTTISLPQILNSLLIIAGGIAARTLACTSVLWTAGFDYKEILFINVAWLPKATVQAAIGSLALDRVRSVTPMNQTYLFNGEITLTIAVLSILITAPMGAIGINGLGKVLLKQDKPQIPHSPDCSNTAVAVA